MCAHVLLRRLHYRVYLKGVTPYALVQNVSYYTTEQGAPRLIMTRRYGLRNGPNNPSGGLGVPPDGSLFVLTTCASTSSYPFQCRSDLWVAGASYLHLHACHTIGSPTHLA